MMTLFAGLLGRLNMQALPHDMVTAGGGVMMVGAVLLIVAVLTYFKLWGRLWREWITTVDPKKIGIMYIVVSVVMLLRGFADVLLMRTQQALASGAHHGIIDAYHFQQVFSAHGTIMIFFVAMGLMFGLINLIVPLQIGSRDVAFPFMNAASFWLFFGGMALINMSLLIGEFSAAGWLAYPPLSELQFSPGVGVDYWIWALQIAGIGSLLSGINFFVTILKLRTVGMTLMRMPLFAWSVLCSMTLVIFAFPILTVSLTLLWLDRALGMHFFTAGAGGNAMMYVNLIWAWGHPEVYILVLPAFGVYSEVVSTFARKRLFGYTSMVWALVAITFLSFVVWLHHFFTMGAGADVNAFFGIMTGIIAIPTGVKIFNWLFTMHRGRISLTTPMLWFLGFVVIFTIGGVAGVLLSIPGIDFQVHNSLFLVAHFHMMIVGGVVFADFAALTYWFPKVFGFRLNERLGRYAFWCWFIGFLLAFVPLYILGFMGATRRLNHYDASLGWQPLFVVAAIGALVVAAGIGFQVLQYGVSIWQHRHSRDTTGDPWDGRTLEWSTTSPPPEYNYATLPVVADRDAFWAMKQAGARPKPHYEDITIPNNTPLPVIIGLLATTIGFAIVWHIYWLAGLALAAVLVVLIVRLTDDHTDHVLPAAEVKRLETA